MFSFQTYEALRPRFPGVVSVLRAIPDVDAHDLHRLDEKLAANHNKPAKIDKSKRDLFKKITSRVSYSLLYRKLIFYTNRYNFQLLNKLFIVFVSLLNILSYLYICTGNTKNMRCSVFHVETLLFKFKHSSSWTLLFCFGTFLEDSK